MVLLALSNGIGSAIQWFRTRYPLTGASKTIDGAMQNHWIARGRLMDAKRKGNIFAKMGCRNVGKNVLFFHFNI